MTMKEIVYPGEQEFLLEYKNNGYDISDVTEAVIIGAQPEFLLNKLK